MERAKIEERAPESVDHELSLDDSGPIEFFPTGSFMLDLALGGGWGAGRAINLVGDFSSGKTLVAIEACANFGRKFGKDKLIRYTESEAAFDESYADLIGMPEWVSLLEGAITKVEEFYEDLKAQLKAHPKGPSLYVLDSVDALSTDSEMEAEIGKQYYSNKAKMLNEAMRRSTSSARQANCCLFLISQIRENVGAMPFAPKYRIAGGKALDFYCSQRVWLTKKGNIKRTRKGIDHIIGNVTEAAVKKNKLGVAHRKVDLHILYNYGIDDERTTLAWLRENKIPIPGFADHKDAEKQVDSLRKQRDRSALAGISSLLKDTAKTAWEEIQEDLMPTMQKYE